MLKTIWVIFVFNQWNFPAETEKLLYTDEEWAILKKDEEVAEKLKGTIKIESKEDVRLNNYMIPL